MNIPSAAGVGCPSEPLVHAASEKITGPVKLAIFVMVLPGDGII
jgi:hypothetical protein